MNSALLALALYAGLNGLILLLINLHIGNVRMSEGVSIGDAGNTRLVRAMRGQANFVENVPLILFLLLLLVLMSMPAWVIHILGAALVAGRAIHAIHFMAIDAPRWQRFYGFILTNAVLLVAVLAAIIHSILGMIS